MKTLKDIHLVLFLTEGATLVEWDRIGLLPREAELYQRLVSQLGSIAWVTYGGHSDLRYADRLDGIEILPNRWRLPNEVYIQQLPWLHRHAFQRANVVKSEQTGAARAAMRVAKHYGLPYIARSGFSVALFAQYDPTQFEDQHHAILELERRSFQHAQAIVVTTEEMRQNALQTHLIPPEEVHVIPNYVNTERFTFRQQQPQTDRPRLLFIGRLVEQKNVLNLLDAVAPLRHIQLDIIGDGNLRGTLENRTADLPHVHLLGTRPNHELPAHLATATLYVQPSLYEGHPKTIFEAMASGVPVLAGDVPGVRQFIEHGVTGWLVASDAASIREGIVTLLADADLRERLREHGRAYVVEHFALDAVVPMELSILKRAANASAPPAQPEARPIFKSLWTYVQRTLRMIWLMLRPH